MVTLYFSQHSELKKRDLFEQHTVQTLIQACDTLDYISEMINGALWPVGKQSCILWFTAHIQGVLEKHQNLNRTAGVALAIHNGPP